MGDLKRFSRIVVFSIDEDRVGFEFFLMELGFFFFVSLEKFGEVWVIFFKKMLGNFFWSSVDFIEYVSFYEDVSVERRVVWFLVSYISFVSRRFSGFFFRFYFIVV